MESKMCMDSVKWFECEQNEAAQVKQKIQWDRAVVSLFGEHHTEAQHDFRLYSACAFFNEKLKQSVKFSTELTYKTKYVYG